MGVLFVDIIVLLVLLVVILVYEFHRSYSLILVRQVNVLSHTVYRQSSLFHHRRLCGCLLNHGKKKFWLESLVQAGDLL